MTILADFPQGLRDPADVEIFNKELKSIWHQERALLNNPVCDFRQYTFGDDGSGNVERTLVAEHKEIECSVPNLDDEQIANSGGLILPTDRFLSVYDTNPNILSVVEWPSESGYLFTIKRKEWNPASGRCEMLIRQGNHLSGIVYKHITGKSFDGNWVVTETTSDSVITANRSDLDYTEHLIFGGIAASGDIVFWALKSEFRTDPDDEDTQFSPSVDDIIVDQDVESKDAAYRVIAYRLDADEDFYRLLARRYEETRP